MPDALLPDPSTAALLFLAVAAFFAGYVDAIVGGGGLVQIPSLLAAFPHASAATVFGTNKLASVVGTASAAIQYARRIRPDWKFALPTIAAAFTASWFGARSVAHFPPELLRPVVLVLLCVVAGYTFADKNFGRTTHDHGHSLRAKQWRGALIGGSVGFYDGFFGPGTGSFLIFAFVRFVGLDFLRASATAKIANVATNAAAILFFAGRTGPLWQLALLMACCNLAGALVGSRMALSRGTDFVRRVFLFVVTLLILKLACDQLAGGST